MPDYSVEELPADPGVAVSCATKGVSVGGGGTPKGGADTGGAVAIVEHTFVPGAMVPPHVHVHEDEISIVIEGEVGFRSNDSEVVVGRGGYVVKPRGEVHSMWNAGSRPARIVEVISPAGFEEYFRRLSAITATGRPDPARIVELTNAYARPSEEPDWLADVIARYRLTPPPSLPR